MQHPMCAPCTCIINFSLLYGTFYVVWTFISTNCRFAFFSWGLRGQGKLLSSHIKMFFLLSFLYSFYLSFPEQTFLSCDRPCHHLDWPMICRVKLTLEVFQSLSKYVRKSLSWSSHPFRMDLIFAHTRYKILKNFVMNICQKNVK